jgi:hypothetical protein
MNGITVMQLEANCEIGDRLTIMAMLFHELHQSLSNTFTSDEPRLLTHSQPAFSDYLPYGVCVRLGDFDRDVRKNEAFRALREKSYLVV